MNTQELVERLGENREEIVKKAVQCKTAAELMKLAENNRIKLTEEEAGQLIALLRPRDVELSLSDLDAVTGGGDEKVNKECTWCGSRNTYFNPDLYKNICEDCRMTF